jgi:hypothetical protein
MSYAKVVQKLAMGHSPASICCVAGPKCLVAIRVGIRFTLNCNEVDILSILILDYNILYY